MSQHTTRALRIALLVMAIGLVFEITIQTISLHVSIWGLPIHAILFITSSAFLVSVVMLLREKKSRSVLTNEIERRRKAEQELHLKAAALESAANGIVITDHEGAIVWVNPAFSKLTGYSAEEVLGKTQRILKSDRQNADFYDSMWREIQAGSVWQGEIFNRRKDGSLYLEDETITPVRSDGAEISHFIAIKVDATERRHSELELRRLNRTLSTLSGCNAVLVHATDENQLLNQICDVVVHVGGFRLAWVGYTENDGDKAVRLMAKSGFDDGYIEKAQITWADTERGWGPAGTAIRTGEVCILRDILQTPQFTPWRDDAVQRGYASIISLPLREGSQTFGVLNIYAPEPNAFDDPEVELLKELAADLAYGVTALRHETERRRAEAALRESEERYRMLFARNPHPMWTCDVETRAFLEVNDAAVAHYGYSREEFLQMTVEDIRPPEDVPGLLSTLSNAECGYTSSESTRHRKKDGTVIYVDTAVYRFMQYGKLVSLVLATDITERRRAEESVRRSEAELRSFVENSPFGIFRSSIEEDRFLAVNSALVKMLGYASEEELLSSRLTTNIIDPWEREAILGLLLRDGGDGSLSGIDSRYRRKDGTIGTARFCGRVQESPAGGFVFEGIAEDVTERKQAEHALRDSEERFRRAVEGAPTGMYIQTEGILRYFNPAALAIFGAESASQIVGRGFLEVIHPDTRPAVIERARRVLEEKEAAPFLEERLLRLDGTVFDGEVTAVPFVFEGRDGALVFVRDITRRKREEEKRRVLEQQLRQAQKMEAVGRLAGGVAHDFNNLLMVIQGYTEMLQDSLPVHDRLRKNTEQVLKAAHRAASLTGQMLAFSRKQITSPVALDLNAMIDETAKMLKRLIGEDIEFQVDSAESLWTISADPDQIGQVLMNLCVNSRDAMPLGGMLTIATENVTVKGGSIGRPQYVAPGDYVKLSVTDTGAGISKEQQEQIFEPFFTTKEVGKGTGLGLAMVYGIVKQNGGYVWVESEPGQGASFTIYLPRVKGVIAFDTSAKADALPRGTETLLVAEDEEAVREAMCGYLRGLGYTVLVASSGQQALSVASEHEGHIDLLITDVVMPKMSGRELSEMLTSLRPGVKTIHISGYADDAVLRHGIHELGAHFLQKPFSLGTLAREVSDTLGRTEAEQPAARSTQAQYETDSI
jgi:PAS domain S-box-containing protein